MDHVLPPDSVAAMNFGEPLPDILKKGTLGTGPICVDLDGTLIREDLSFSSLKATLRHTPSLLFPLMRIWWRWGRSGVKQAVSAHITQKTIEDLTYNIPLITHLRELAPDHTLVLITGADYHAALRVAAHLNLFHAVIASHPGLNCIGRTKAMILNQRFGKSNYTYIGNSYQDYWIWRDAHTRIMVDTPRILRWIFKR